MSLTVRSKRIRQAVFQGSALSCQVRFRIHYVTCPEGEMRSCAARQLARSLGFCKHFDRRKVHRTSSQQFQNIQGRSVGGIVGSGPQAISLLVGRHSAEAEVIMSNKVGMFCLPSLFSWAGVTPFEAPVNLRCRRLTHKQGVGGSLPGWRPMKSR